MPTAPDPTDGPVRPAASGRRSWHRRAARPVSVWMLLLVVAVVAHPWVPQSRWLIVHMVTLGLITTSIMVWGQHFAEALLKTRLGEESRPRQVLRIRLLSVGLTVSATLLTLWPTVLRTRLDPAGTARAALGLVGMGVGVLGARPAR